ncbi:UBX domain-containing protein 1 [Leucoagaricus sp. SymC.cos]|nr:UBX domain-containing protein 1 [Leucoagaricus sp. SymC.cos]
MPPKFGRIGDWSKDEDERDEHSGDENDKRESWFAGGERSGISVQNPGRPRDDSQAGGGDLVQELLRRAAESGAAPREERTTGFRVFSGGGHTLGSDEVASSYVPDPNAQTDEEDEVATRMITLWQDGFQIEDGDLMRYDDPANSQIIRDLNAGTAPLHLLNVRPGQPVELRINPRQQEPYRPLPGVRVFRGTGQRLGAPVPEITLGSSSMPGSFPSTAPTAASSSSSSGADRPSVMTRFEVDQTKPTTSVQVRLADGTRMVCRMNLTHTVGDIRNFINASRPENLSRPYTIGTTFPNRVLEDDSATIESAGLVNSVIVQRWI